MADITAKYLGDLRVECVHQQSGTVLVTDAPKDNNGKGEAFCPTDLCATALAAPVEKQTFRVVAPEGWTVTAVPDVTEGVVLVAPDKSVSVTIVTAASGTMTPEQLAADYEQKLHAARVAQNGNYYGLKGMAGDLPLEVCLWTFDGMHGVASIVGRTGHPALQGIVDSLEFYK